MLCRWARPAVVGLTRRAEWGVYPSCARRCPGPSGAEAGREGSVSLMPAAVPASVTIPAVPEQVRESRAFVARVLGESHTQLDLALLLASKLVTNSVRHSGSAVPGGVVK